MQYFYLVCRVFDESTYPLKIFLQEKEATKWGRRIATELRKESDLISEVVVYKQPITRKGTLKYIDALNPYTIKGADWDIDKTRTEE